MPTPAAPRRLYCIFLLPLLLVALFSLLCSAVAHAQTYTWQTLAAAPQNGQKQDDIFFVDPQQGWAVNGSGQIHRTQDGGQTWTRQLNQPGTYFRCVGFLNALTGFAGNIGPNYFPGVTDANPLYRTQDGGQSWQPVAASAISGPAPTGLCAISVASPQVVYAAGRVGGPAYFLKSTDGGQTWTSRSLSAQIQMITDVHFVASDTGFVFGGSNANVQLSSAVVLATTDGGQTFQEVYRSARPFELVWKAAFPSRRTGYLTLLSYAPNTPLRYVAKTQDGGLTWQETPFVNNGCKEFGVGFATDRLGWVGTDTGSGYETQDGGQTWQASSLGRYVNKVRLLRGPGGQLTAYAIGLNVSKLTAVLATAKPGAPASAALQAFPNPTSRQVVLRYELPRRQHVRLALADLTGRTLDPGLDFVQDAGPHEITYTLPAQLSNNLVQFNLITEDGRHTLPVSVQP